MRSPLPIDCCNEIVVLLCEYASCRIRHNETPSWINCPIGDLKQLGVDYCWKFFHSSSTTEILIWRNHLVVRLRVCSQISNNGRDENHISASSIKVHSFNVHDFSPRLTIHQFASTQPIRKWIISRETISLSHKMRIGRVNYKLDSLWTLCRQPVGY